jgi:antitoxin HigA-1
MKNRMRPIHPGEILREEFLGAPRHECPRAGLSARRTGKPGELHRRGQARYLGGHGAASRQGFPDGPEVWLNLQQTYDLRMAELDKKAKRSRVKVVLRSKTNDKAHAA